MVRGMRCAVFAGPSLAGIDAAFIAGMDLLPPAACGDLLRAVKNGYRSIGLIDGTFESRPAVWHKEILYGLSRGCRIMGAASMGALRAAECWTFGMGGVGAIYTDYRNGRRRADSDVALLHGPEETGYRPLTIALVDAEFWIGQLLEKRVIGNGEQAALLAAAHALPYKLRDWENLLDQSGLTPIRQRELSQFLDQLGPGIKTIDALALLDALRRAEADAPAQMQIYDTLFFRQLMTQTG